ncbi:hypothetical protein BWI93_11585 [Siphonobacter sp. BAB-5385]|uniref:helix-turn-helix domain-containing protein n=1 Tax=Siphonobacter sp. BAB-5385 TaxID=1864822 RepID=UPI000B9DD358|nr:helix-turn-helix domain-containing protein [Siphonobacter sp. BAB-5385]OZI07990.1 hypothetical protein BWI93_11585 [Siphonobacter sp. BAB-5385]
MEVHIPELTKLLTQVDLLSNQLSRMERLFFEKQDKPFLTVTDVATELRLSDYTIKAWINKGRKHPQTRKVIKLNAVKTDGGHYRIKRKDLETFNELFTSK